MKTLYLVRHAKSSWEDQAFNDVDRPLKSSGVQDAHLMGDFIKKKGIRPDLIISSPAARAMHTAVAFAGKMDYPFNRIVLDEKLYESSATDILEVISRYATTENSIMVFGHDPSLSNLFMKLTSRNVEKIPTSAIVAISLETDNWKDFSDSRGNMLFLERPKEVRLMLNNG